MAWARLLSPAAPAPRTDLFGLRSQSVAGMRRGVGFIAPIGGTGW